MCACTVAPVRVLPTLRWVPDRAGQPGPMDLAIFGFFRGSTASETVLGGTPRNPRKIRERGSRGGLHPPRARAWEGLEMSTNSLGAGWCRPPGGIEMLASSLIPVLKDELVWWRSQVGKTPAQSSIDRSENPRYRRWFDRIGFAGAFRRRASTSGPIPWAARPFCAAVRGVAPGETWRSWLAPCSESRKNPRYCYVCRSSGH